MKILQIIDSLESGGAERMAVNMAMAFRNRGWSNAIVVTRRSGPLAAQLPQDIPVYVLHKRRTADLAAWRRLRQIVRQDPPDVIHAHSVSVYWAIMLKRHLPTAKLIWHDHFGGLHHRLPGLAMLSRRIDANVVVNEALLERNRSWLRQTPVWQLPNFAMLRDLHRQPQDPPVLLCLANLRPEKGHRFLVASLGLLAWRHPELRWRCCLLGSTPDPELLVQLKADIVQHALEDRIDICGPSDDPATWLERSQIGILPSETEGLPLALLEYAQAGLPVVCTRAGQCPALLRQGEGGWLVDYGDTAAMAKALYEALTQPALATAKSSVLQSHTNAHNSPEAFIKQYESILGHLQVPWGSPK